MNSRQFKHPCSLFLAACISTIAVTQSQAVIVANYTPGDIILGVQSSAVTATVLEVNIGPAAQFKNNSSTFLIGNIASQLGTQFTNTWYDSPNLFFGVSGANNNFNLNAGTADANGDFNSTIYASRARNASIAAGLAGSTAWNFSAASVTTAASPMLQQASTYDANDASGIATVMSSVANEWSDFNPVSGTAQNPAYAQVFTTGIQARLDTGSFDGGTFGGLTDVEGAVDLYQIARFNNGGGIPGVGTFLGTIVLERDGDIRFVGVPEPGSAMLLTVGLLGVTAARRPKR